MFFESIGKGPDLVLVHGWAMHSGIFSPLANLLIEKFRVHLVDLPGHGRAKDDEQPLDLARCATQIAQHIPKAVWVGWSLGGCIVLQGALDHPENICGIVEIASSPRFVATDDWRYGTDAQLLAQFAAGLAVDFRKTVDGFLALEAHGSAHAQSELREFKKRVFEYGEPSLRALQQGLELLETSDFRAQLSSLRMPSLWIAGRRDRLITPGAMRWAADHSPGGRYLEISSGHAPFIGHPQEVMDAISAFAENFAT